MARNYKQEREGVVFNSNSFGLFIVVEYNGICDCLVQFKNTGAYKKCKWTNIINGRVSDDYAITVAGVGYLGENHPVNNHTISNRWQKMLRRCYDPDNPRYKDYGAKGISVCERWHNLSNYYEDVSKMENYDKLIKEPDKWHIDKDILGGKCYSKDNCLIVELKTNQQASHSIIIQQFKMNGDFISEYSSITEASKATGCCNSSISKCARGIFKQCGGFIWRFKES